MNGLKLALDTIKSLLLNLRLVIRNITSAKMIKLSRVIAATGHTQHKETAKVLATCLSNQIRLKNNVIMMCHYDVEFCTGMVTIARGPPNLSNFLISRNNYLGQ